MVLDPLFATRQHKKPIKQSAKTEDEDTVPVPFLQIKAELDTEHQRFELAATQKGPCELAGQNGRHELNAQGDVETRDVSTLPELD